MEVRVSRRSVHLVDDNATFCKTIEGHLQQFGYEVLTYPSAQHLLDRLPSNDVPSCILLDVRLPGMSGLELQEHLIELGSVLPIIFVTGYPDIPATVRTIKAGAEDFLIKPISSEALLQSVERAVARHEAVLQARQARDTFLARLATLTAREQQVFELLIRGESKQGNRCQTGHNCAHDQSSPPSSNGENASQVVGRTRLSCRKSWHHGCRIVGRPRCELARDSRICPWIARAPLRRPSKP